MLQEMTVNELRYWQYHKILAAWGPERADIHAAQICQMLANINRDTKAHPQPYTLDEALLKFGDAAVKKHVEASKPQSQADIERNVTAMIMGHNQVLAEERLHGIIRE